MIGTFEMIEGRGGGDSEAGWLASVDDLKTSTEIEPGGTTAQHSSAVVRCLPMTVLDLVSRCAGAIAIMHKRTSRRRTIRGMNRRG